MTQSWAHEAEICVINVPINVSAVAFVHAKAQLKASVWMQHVGQERQAIVTKLDVFVDGDDQVFTKVFAQQSLTPQQSKSLRPQQQPYESGRKSGPRCWRQQLMTAPRLMK